MKCTYCFSIRMSAEKRPNGEVVGGSTDDDSTVRGPMNSSDAKWWMSCAPCIDSSSSNRVQPEQEISTEVSGETQLQ